MEHMGKGMHAWQACVQALLAHTTRMHAHNLQAMCQDLCVTGPKGSLRLSDFVIPHNETRGELSVTSVSLGCLARHEARGSMWAAMLLHVHARPAAHFCSQPTCSDAAGSLCLQVDGFGLTPIANGTTLETVTTK